MNENDEIQTTQIVSSPQRVRVTHEFRDLREIEQLGALTLQQRLREIEDWPEHQEDDYVVGGVRVRWLLEIDGLAYPVPKEIYRGVTEEDEPIPGLDFEKEREERRRRFAGHVHTVTQPSYVWPAGHNPLSMDLVLNVSPPISVEE